MQLDLMWASMLFLRPYCRLTTLWHCELFLDAPEPKYHLVSLSCQLAIRQQPKTNSQTQFEE